MSQKEFKIGDLVEVFLVGEIPRYDKWRYALVIGDMHKDRDSIDLIRIRYIKDSTYVVNYPVRSLKKIS